ncbi:hypothetical protein AC578_2334 [Pseudocercospora eumusae]|uniref:Uncharacterized protein n=1 Tax=Pseudocercospora eumusae TaxID=321146 RepID=A0A139HXN0_9PEZI|nr:hypothetical protein AC578_2334 [Pseudocercospora eumusae]
MVEERCFKLFILLHISASHCQSRSWKPFSPHASTHNSKQAPPHSASHITAVCVPSCRSNH